TTCKGVGSLHYDDCPRGGATPAAGVRLPSGTPDLLPNHHHHPLPEGSRQGTTGPITAITIQTSMKSFWPLPSHVALTTRRHFLVRQSGVTPTAARTLAPPTDGQQKISKTSPEKPYHCRAMLGTSILT
ncbi:hypothetical protein Bbelb_216060, partial [Branchiostoma belcheri]